MADDLSITDPSDWTSTSLPYLTSLDAALRCEVCKDFYTAPVITNCCHTFCSLCIRRALHADGICPICRSQEQEFRLRKNTTVQDLLDAFVACRGKLMEVAIAKPVVGVREGTAAEAEAEGNEEKAEQESQASQRSTRASRRGRRKEVIPGSDDEVDEAYAPEPEPPRRKATPPPPDDGLVACPICSRRMKETSINSHLDKCMIDPSPPSPPKPKPPPRASLAPLSPVRRLRSAPSIPTRTKPTGPPMEPLPRLTYSHLTDTKLRAKLRELGIPEHGTRKLMQERHTEWKNLWNANIDSEYPKSKRELLRELDVWERAHTKPVNNKTKEATWSDEAWGAKHGGDFKDLVEAAKRGIKRKKVEETSERDEKKELEVKDEAPNADPNPQIQEAEAMKEESKAESPGSQQPLEPSQEPPLRSLALSPRPRPVDKSITAPPQDLTWNQSAYGIMVAHPRSEVPPFASQRSRSSISALLDNPPPPSNQPSYQFPSLSRPAQQFQLPSILQQNISQGALPPLNAISPSQGTFPVASSGFPGSSPGALPGALPGFSSMFSGRSSNEANKEAQEPPAGLPPIDMGRRESFTGTLPSLPEIQRPNEKRKYSSIE